MTNVFWASLGTWLKHWNLLKKVRWTILVFQKVRQVRERIYHVYTSTTHLFLMGTKKGCHQFFFYYYQSRLPNLWANLQACLQTVTVTTTQVMKMDCATVFTRVMVRLEQTCNNCKILGSLADKMTTKSHLSSCKKEEHIP